MYDVIILALTCLASLNNTSYISSLLEAKPGHHGGHKGGHHDGHHGGHHDGHHHHMRKRKSVYNTSNDPKEIRQANKQLLGKLYTDQLYLERLLENPVINHVSLGEEKVDIVQKRVNYLYDLSFQ